MVQHQEKLSQNETQAAAANTNRGNTAIQLKNNREISVVQQKLSEKTVNKETAAAPIQRKQNDTGLPDNLKSGIENLSGHSMDDVKVHYNSSQPAQLNAHAYAQGTDIHIASGQEKHLPHEAWHVVQQKQGRVKPTLQMKSKVNINDDKGLENEADVMGAKAIQFSSNTYSTQNKPNADSSLQKKSIIQRYVTLGREASGIYGTIGVSGPTMKRMLYEKDLPEIENAIIKYYATIPDEANPDSGMSAQNVAVWRSIKTHAFLNFGEIKAKLKEWVGSSIEIIATTTGKDDQAHWRQYETIEELALALAHETLPLYKANLHAENTLAGNVNESEWIEHQLSSVINKVRTYMEEDISRFRYIAEYIEPYMVGSYSWGSRLTSIGSLFSTIRGTAKPSEQISTTKQSITKSITFLHDLMERWSDSGGGSMAAKAHEIFQVQNILHGAKDLAYESTMVDEDLSDFSKPTPDISLHRATPTIDDTDHEKVLFELAIKRTIRTAERCLEDINIIDGLRKQLKTEKDSKKLEALNLEITQIELRISKRKARLAQDYDQFTFNESSNVQHGSASQVDPDSLPERSTLAAYLIDKRKQREKEKLKKVTIGSVDKSSSSKGRRNVGTRLEHSPDSLMARLFSAPISAGRSMTTARMMQLVEQVGGTPEEKTAVAYALFAYWARTYNKGLTPIHSYVETLDVARNYGVPYKAFHYPQPGKDSVIDFMCPVEYRKMSALVPDSISLPVSASSKKPSKAPEERSPSVWARMAARINFLPPHGGILSPQNVLMELIQTRAYESGYNNFWGAYNDFRRDHPSYQYSLSPVQVINLINNQSPTRLYIMNNEDWLQYENFKKRNRTFYYPHDH